MEQLPEEAVESLPLGIFSVWMESALGNLNKVSLALSRLWTRDL